MKKISHITLGLLTGIAFNLPISTSVLGSLAPDLDIKWTKSNNSLLFSHRGITHHILLALFLLLIALIIDNKWFTGFTAGYISHLFGDFLTKSGIPYWMHKDRIALKLFATGDKIEFFFVICLFLIIIFVLYILYGVNSIIPYEIQLLANI